MSLPDIATRLERAASTATIAGRSLLGLDTNPVAADWRHITKVDPEGEKQLPLCYPLYLSHTSAISVGGSRDVTSENTAETFDLLEFSPAPAFHEPSDATHVTDETREQSTFLAIPEVLNGDSEALVGTLGLGIEYVKEDLGPSMLADKLGVSLDGVFGDRIGNFAAGYMLQDAVFEAYIIMNSDSAAAREANVTEDDLLSPQVAKQRALAAEHHLESEVIYLEYSGTYGGEEAVDILEAIDGATTWSRLWYGGGLDNRENAQAVLDAGADAVVVGDIFHDIAAEEAELFEQARTEFDGPVEVDAIRDWIETTATVPEMSATRYLSTITDVPQPETQALDYLASGVSFALELERIADRTETDTQSAIREAVEDETLAVEADLAEVLNGSNATAFTNSVGTALVADSQDGDSDLPSRHLGISL
ncbi:geranylgeranylglyceryl/heptaprenylglyceryl phosphate synthase [Halovenus salina]|uniref:phosphoglycerol geranylgeranyltransferase n=1 Tax=Halovenus salina TaxID=1510225 RepID=A0ABD5WA90_9EURY|nr:geranylgeranylglyceryl/heptaprenylglyceryl phosphate synthase [Halovenus salina]